LMSEQANKMDMEVLKTGFDKFARIELDLKYSANPQNLFEAVCISLLSVQRQGAVREIYIPASQPVNNVPIQPVKAERVVENNAPIINSNHNNANVNITNSSDINKLWGSVLLEIKKRNMFALSSSLRDIYGVHMVGNCLVLQTNDQTVLKSVDEPARLDVILSIASTLDDKIKRVEVKYDEANRSSKDVVAELKNIFMDKLKVKE